MNPRALVLLGANSKAAPAGILKPSSKFSRDSSLEPAQEKLDQVRENFR